MPAAERALFAFNASANRAALAAYRKVAESSRRKRGAGLTRDLHQLLVHLVDVEVGYLRAVLDQPDEEIKDATAAELERHNRWASAGFEAFLATATDAKLGRTIRVPWWSFDATVREVLLHTVVHSAQHRADIATALTQIGAKPPELGFASFVRRSRAKKPKPRRASAPPPRSSP